MHQVIYRAFNNPNEPIKVGSSFLLIYSDDGILKLADVSGKILEKIKLSDFKLSETIDLLERYYEKDSTNHH